jgi:hypothetical protein
MWIKSDRNGYMFVLLPERSTENPLGVWLACTRPRVPAAKHIQIYNWRLERVLCKTAAVHPWTSISDSILVHVL